MIVLFISNGRYSYLCCSLPAPRFPVLWRVVKLFPSWTARNEESLTTHVVHFYCLLGHMRKIKDDPRGRQLSYYLLHSFLQKSYNLSVLFKREWSQLSMTNPRFLEGNFLCFQQRKEYFQWSYMCHPNWCTPEGCLDTLLWWGAPCSEPPPCKHHWYA